MTQTNGHRVFLGALFYNFGGKIKMDKRLQQIAENFDDMKIGVDDKFHFSCKQCGKCCTEREDILLSPHDLFRAAKKLNMTPDEFVKEYCDSYVGDTSKMVLVRLRPRGTIKRCPMLKDRKCSIHDVKPMVCAMFPIGRGFQLDPKKPSDEQISVENIQFIFNGATCGNKEEHTVREWFETFGIPIKDEIFVEWHKAISAIGEVTQYAEKTGTSEKLLNLIYTVIYGMMYIEYDTSQDFLPQFIRNRDKLLNLLHTMPGFSKRRNKDAK